MKNNFARALALLTQLGLTMLVTIMLCMFIGKWLDSKLGTSFIFLIIFTILGVLSSFMNMYKMVIKNFKD